jgi:ubiquinone/menaquinone biosynthesis C-methylase UbiE
MVHPSAATGFARSVEAYERARPDYPPEAIAWLAEELDLRPGRTVVDLAAGSGKLTRPLAALGCEVIAIEPVAEMRAAIGSAARALDGTAEAMPLPDDSADAVTVGQAFHWFDGPAALAEIARVLVPGGVLGLLWNMRDDRVPWVAELTKILRGAGDVLTDSGGLARPLATEAFTAAERREFPNPTEFDRARLREWASSTSRIAILSEAERERVLADVARLAEEHPDLAGRRTFDMPFVVVAVRTRKR